MTQHYRPRHRPNTFSLRHDPPRPPRIMLPFLLVNAPVLLLVVALFLLEVTR